MTARRHQTYSVKLGSHGPTRSLRTLWAAACALRPGANLHVPPHIPAVDRLADLLCHPCPHNDLLHRHLVHPPPLPGRAHRPEPLVCQERECGRHRRRLCHHGTLNTMPTQARREKEAKAGACVRVASAVAGVLPEAAHRGAQAAAAHLEDVPHVGQE